MNKQIHDFVTYFKNMFNFNENTAKESNDQSGKLEQQIRESQIRLDQMKTTQPFIQKVLILLLIILAIYAVGSFIGQIVHTIALLVLIGGGLYIYFENV